MVRGVVGLGDGFEWIDVAWGKALRCVPLAEVAPHLFTTRQLALGGGEAGQAEAYGLVAQAIGIPVTGLSHSRQVHGTGVAVLRRSECARDERRRRPQPTADIIATDDPERAVLVQVADCVPLLVADRCRGAVAAAHAGWRGTAAGIAAVTVRALARAFGSRPADLVAAIGPSIGPCCYEVGEDVREAFRGGLPARAAIDTWFAAGPRGRSRLDLWRATRDQLCAEGVPDSQIHASALCSATHDALFYSYRREGKGTGRLLGVIRAGRVASDC